MIGNITTRIALITLMAAAALIMVVSTALANNGGGNNGDDCKPGWGWGDKNHCHSGPPGGPSVHPVHGTP